VLKYITKIFLYRVPGFQKGNSLAGTNLEPKGGSGGHSLESTRKH